MKTTRRCSAFGGVVMAALLCAGCPDGVSATDGGADFPQDVQADNPVDDQADAPRDLGGELPDGATFMDAADAPETDIGLPTCVPGSSTACACEDGRMGAQVCRADGTFGACRCVSADAATDAAPDVVLPPLGPRLVGPVSASRVTSQRPTMRWVLPDGVTRVRVELCGDRTCTRMRQQQEVSGTSWRPATPLTPGVVFWRVRGLAGDGSVGWTSATWEYLVGRRDAPVDTSFGTLKDFNSDGFDDVAVIEALFDPDLVDRVSLFHGGAGPVGMGPSIQLTQGVDARRQIGAGDLNGDGVADLLVSAQTASTLRVYHGRAGGLRETPDTDLRIERPSGGGRGVNSNFATGDFNGDGFGDVVIFDDTEIDHSDPRPQARKLRIHRGGPDGMELMPSRIENLPDDFSRSPYRVDCMRNVGDVNGDGYTDLLLTYQSQGSEAEGLSGVGRAWLATGGPGFPLAAWHRIDPPTAARQFGFECGAVGDLNGDGHADFAISAQDQVSIYLGTRDAIPTTPARTLRNPGVGCYVTEGSFGGYIGPAGDYNGDGLADLSIGAPCLPSMPTDLLYREGMVFLYPGSATGVSDVALTMQGSYFGARFGTGVGGFGDLNGDGFDDLIVLQERGYLPTGNETPPVFVYQGSLSGINPTLRWVFRIRSEGLTSYEFA